MNPDVVVVGGGPAGAASGFWLAQRGLDVLVVEKKTFPRAKTCGDGLTPRAIRQLVDMGFDFDVPELHKITGLRAYAGSRKLEMAWPEHSIYPNWGAVIRRADLDGQVALLAEKQGAVIRQGTEAKPIVEDGALVGVELTENGSDPEIVRPKVVVIADGSNSRFGRAMGAARRRDYPFALAVRGYWASPNSGDTFLESQLDIRDKDGRAMPGYGWVFPLGDGTINVGVGVLSTFKGWKAVNTSHMLEAFVDGLPDYWGLDLGSRVVEPTGGKLPMAFSVTPKAGLNWVAVGDAAGAVNPFNGEGIDYGYETGRIAAGVVERAVKQEDLRILGDYEKAIDDEYRLYNKVARVFVNLIGNPVIMKTLVHTGMKSRPLMEWTLRVMANLLEPEDKGIGDRAYAMIERVVAMGPEPRVR